MKRLPLLVLLAALACGHAPLAPVPHATLAIVGANVLTMTSANVLPSQTVLIDGNRIVAVGPARDVRVPAGVRAIDGRGLYLLPGLADMHVHMTTDDLPLFLANGVTTIRELNGTPKHLELRDAIARGGRQGPRMIVSGPLLSGIKQRWRHRLITTAAEGTSEVESELAAGYDEIKIYSGLTPESYAAIVAAAKKGGKRFVGHVPAAVGLAAAVEAGQSTVEHTEMLAEFAGHPPDPARIDAAVALLRAHGTYFTPTLGVENVLGALGSAETLALFDSVPMDLVDSGTRGWWNSLRGRKSGPDSAAYVSFKRQAVRRAHDAGVPLLFGTDTPNPLIVPGFGIHVETQALRGAGLEPFAILQMMTVNPARYLGRSQTMGLVAAGADADLLLVDGNPLADITALRNVRGLVLQGAWLDRQALDTGVERARRAAAQ
jgi:imidazolonepropionase-like amidohydrolase